MFKLFFKVLRLFIIILTLQRLLFLILFFSRWQQNSAIDVVKCLLTGLRFDLMVSGYCLLPFLILFFPWVQKFALASGTFKFILRILMVLFLTLLVAVGFADLQWHHLFYDRFSSAQSLDQFLSLWSIDGFLFISVAGTAVILFWSGRYLKNIKITERQPMKIRIWLLVLLMVAVIIRGSFDEYHLDLRHSQVTTSKVLNTACVSSPYALDQALRGRR